MTPLRAPEVVRIVGAMRIKHAEPEVFGRLFDSVPGMASLPAGFALPGEWLRVVEYDYLGGAPTGRELVGEVYALDAGACLRVTGRQHSATSAPACGCGECRRPDPML